MEELVDIFEEAKKNHYDYIGVAIQMEGYPSEEIIINRLGNFEKKLEYYKNAFNEDLTLKANNGIKIVGVYATYFFDDIEWGLFED